MATKTATSTTSMRPKVMLVGVFTPYNKSASQEHYFAEFISLVKTLGLTYDEAQFIKLREVDKNTFLSKGKLHDLADFCKANNIEEVVFSEILTPLQERNLEDSLVCTVFDREKLILEIFRNSAKSSEGKIQIEMAEIEFLKTRLIGKGKEYAQQAGYIGGRGPGETIKEEVKQHFAHKLRQASKRLDTLQKARETQRQQRLKSNVPLVCIIGYTNAGKSSLLNRLTKSDILAEDKLFATLDTTTREFFINQNRKLLISDTVGFISQLPHKLIESFKSTLDELRYAALLVHVVDISNPAWRHQIRVVQDTLKDLAVEKPMIYAFNKIDKLSELELEKLNDELQDYYPHVLIHTASKEGIEKLVHYISTHNF